MLQTEATIAFCIMTGVLRTDQFERMESSGVDWCLAAGINISATVENANAALNALLRRWTLVRMDGLLEVGAQSVVDPRTSRMELRIARRNCGVAHEKHSPLKRIADPSGYPRENIQIGRFAIWDSNGTHTDRLIAHVYGGKLYPRGTTPPQSLRRNGMNLSDLELESRNVTNFGYVGRHIEWSEQNRNKSTTNAKLSSRRYSDR